MYKIINFTRSLIVAIVSCTAIHFIFTYDITEYRMDQTMSGAID